MKELIDHWLEFLSSHKTDPDNVIWTSDDTKIMNETIAALEQLSKPLKQTTDADIERVAGSELRSMLLCAFRYALGRRTYITSECHDWLVKYWDIMAIYHKQIHDDIKHAIEHDIAGDKCDVESWKKILALPAALNQSNEG